MRFEYPHLLWLLLVLPPTLATFLWWSGHQRQRLMAQFVEARLLAALTAGVSLTRRKIRWACLVAAAALLIVTLARPQWGFTWEETRQRGLDIVVAIDTSKSMLAEDIAPNRLTRAKLAALDLMQQAKSDRLGLVAFAGGAFLQCPLTIDDAAFRQCLDTLDVNIIPQGGTAVAEAIQTATTAFKQGNDNYKVLVLFTDGEDNDEGALEAATQAEKAGLKIFTVGIGTAEGELLRLKDEKGRTDYVRDEQGNVVKSHLNEGLLQQIAGAAGGFYLPLRGAKTIDTLYEKGLAPLPKSESKERLVKRYHERFYWPLALAILLLLVETLFPERRRTNGAASNIQHSTLSAQSSAAALLVALLLSPITINASPSSALREYRAGKYEDALKEYKQLLDKQSDDPRLRFNAGAAAYQDGQFNEAAKHFGDVLSAQDLQLQQHAYYNLGNTFFQIGENTVDPSKKTEAWEKALKDYESTLKLNPQDTDAKFNHEFVKKKLEELKQQQQQQQNQDNKDQKQDQNKQDQQPQQQNQQDQQKDQSQQQQKESEQKQQEQKQSEQQQQAQKDQQQKQDSQQSQAGKDQDKKDQQSAQAQQQKNQPTKEDEQAEAAQAYAGQMTPQQARQLLDAQKAEEAMIPIKPEGKPTPANRPFKDW